MTTCTYRLNEQGISATLAYSIATDTKYCTVCFILTIGAIGKMSHFTIRRHEQIPVELKFTKYTQRNQ